MVKIGLALIGLLHVINGLFMLADPAGWYAAVPGVTATGPMNAHFISDIGFAFLASGAGLLIGIGRRLATFAVAGATWPALHALFHIALWFHHGLPAAADAWLSEVIGVVGIGALGLLLALRRGQQEGVL